MLLKFFPTMAEQSNKVAETKRYYEYSKNKIKSISQVVYFIS